MTEEAPTRKTAHPKAKSKHALGEDYLETLTATTGGSTNANKKRLVEDKGLNKKQREQAANEDLNRSRHGGGDKHPDRCVLRADGTHKDTDKIKFFNDPDNMHPIGYAESRAKEAHCLFPEDDHEYDKHDQARDEDAEHKGGQESEYEGDAHQDDDETQPQQKQKKKQWGKRRVTLPEDNSNEGLGEDEGMKRYEEIINCPPKAPRTQKKKNVTKCLDTFAPSACTFLFCQLFSNS
ncbi:hypothetical protein BJ165DRAFT_1405108 [Panaeolus papilionaceus]|nr:hypothetical protein BJ165DRAFT_1405108 [Panaeolus papilionaceus]